MFYLGNGHRGGCNMTHQCTRVEFLPFLLHDPIVCQSCGGALRLIPSPRPSLLSPQLPLPLMRIQRKITSLTFLRVYSQLDPGHSPRLFTAAMITTTNSALTTPHHAYPHWIIIIFATTTTLRLPQNPLHHQHHQLNHHHSHQGNYRYL